MTMECPSASLSQRLRATLYREQAVDSHGALSVSSLKKRDVHMFYDYHDSHLFVRSGKSAVETKRARHGSYGWRVMGDLR